MSVLPLRFWRKVYADPSGCWLWRGGRSRGYGYFYYGLRNVQVHRLAYEKLIGSIPAGLTIDHQCHNLDTECVGGDACPHRACVCPHHLEAVTMRENATRGAARKATARCGHPFSGVNARGRYCRPCYQASYRVSKRLSDVGEAV